MVRRLLQSLSRPALPPLPGLTPAERAALLGRHRADWHARHPVAAFLPYGLALVVSYRLGPALVPGVPPAALAASAALVLWLGMHVLADRLIGPRVLADLRDAGRCTGCGYDLTGNATGVCPECGARANAAPAGDPPDGSPAARR